MAVAVCVCVCVPEGAAAKPAPYVMYVTSTVISRTASHTGGTGTLIHIGALIPPLHPQENADVC